MTSKAGFEATLIVASRSKKDRYSKEARLGSVDTITIRQHEADKECQVTVLIDTKVPLLWNMTSLPRPAGLRKFWSE